MKYLTMRLGIAVFALASCFSVHAEERVLEITGVVEDLPSPYGAVAPAEMLRFKAYVFERTEASQRANLIPFIDLSYGYSVTRMSIEVLDGEDEIVFTDAIDFEFPRNTSEAEAIPGTDYTYSQFSKLPHDPFWSHQHASWSGTSGSLPEKARLVELGLSFLTRMIAEDDYYQPSVGYDEDALVFVEDSLFPTFIEGALVYPFRYYLANDFGGDLSEFDTGVFGYATQLRYVVLDVDGDGVLDADDQCLASLAADFVTLNGQLLTVENVVDGNGCSVMDHYAACETEQGEGGFLAYSGASYCEQQVAYQLYRAGLIDYADVRELRTALR